MLKWLTIANTRVVTHMTFKSSEERPAPAWSVQSGVASVNRLWTSSLTVSMALMALMTLDSYLPENGELLVCWALS